MIIGARVVFLTRAYESQVLDASDVARVRQVQVTIRVRIIVKLAQRAVVEHLLDEFLVLRITASAPVNIAWLRDVGDVIYPLSQAL